MRLLLAAAFLAAASGAAAQPCGPWSAKVPDGFTVAAAGDIIYERLSLDRIRADAPAVVEALSKADVTFGNFETNSFELATFTGKKRAPGEGPILLTPPAAAGELKRMGFDIVSHANNHAFEWGAEGIAGTASTLDRIGIARAGSGMSQAESRRAACFSTRGVQTALVAASTSFPPNAAGAGPGMNTLRLTKTARGYVMDDADLAALTHAVEAARKVSPVVIFSLHTHDDGNDTKPPAFLVELAHRMVDAGATAFIAHGPHQLRGIEVRNGAPIFYSLANFSVASPRTDINPEPLVLPPGSIFTRREFRENMVASWRYRGGRPAELVLTPFELAKRDDPNTDALPTAASPEAARAIVERLGKLSQPFGTEVRFENGVGIIRIKRKG